MAKYTGNDYSKWDKIDVSDDDEVDEEQEWRSRSLHDEGQERRREMQREVDVWMKRQIHKLQKEGEGPPRAKGLPALTPWRRVTNDERSTLAMLVAVSHFEEGETNLERHPAMLDLVRHNRWLEDDPGALELLCRIHHQVMRNEKNEKPEDSHMRNMLLGAINSLAAPAKCDCPGGLLELMTQICTPITEDSREHRRKWQMKEFAKDALFDSLFPDLRQHREADDKNESSADIWILVILAILALLGVVVLVVLYIGAAPASDRQSRRNATRLAKSLADKAGVTDAVSDAAAAAAAGAAASLASAAAGAAATVDVASAVEAAVGACAAGDETCAAGTSPGAEVAGEPPASAAADAAADAAPDASATPPEL